MVDAKKSSVLPFFSTLTAAGLITSGLYLGSAVTFAADETPSQPAESSDVNSNGGGEDTAEESPTPAADPQPSGNDTTAPASDGAGESNTSENATEEAAPAGEAGAQEGSTGGETANPAPEAAAQEPVTFVDRELWLPQTFGDKSNLEGLKDFLKNELKLEVALDSAKTTLYVKTFDGGKFSSGTVAFEGAEAATTAAENKYPKGISFLGKDDASYPGWMKIDSGDENLKASGAGLYTAKVKYSPESGDAQTVTYKIRVYDEWAVNYVEKGQMLITSGFASASSVDLKTVGEEASTPKDCDGFSSCIADDKLALPQGLTLADSKNGTFAGTVAAAPGDYLVGFVAASKADAAAADVTRLIQFKVYEPATLASGGTVGAKVGGAVDYTPKPQSGKGLGSPKVVYSLKEAGSGAVTGTSVDSASGDTTAAGQLPKGLSFDPATGKITGTIDAAVKPGSYPQIIIAQNDFGAYTYKAPVTKKEEQIVIKVVSEPKVSYELSGIDADTGVVNSKTPESNGDLTYTIEDSAGITGLKIDSKTGELKGNISSGTRVSPIPATGYYQVKVKATNALGESVTVSAPFGVGRKVTFASRPLAENTADDARLKVVAGEAFTLNPASGKEENPLSAPEGVSFYRLKTGYEGPAKTPGNGLPVGLSLNPNTGVITGTVPSGATAEDVPESGTYNVAIEAVSSGGIVTEANYTLKVAQPFEAADSTVYPIKSTALDASSGLLSGIAGTAANSTAVFADDTEKEAVTPGANKVPKGLTLTVATTGSKRVSLTGTSSEAAPGTYTSTVKVTSGGETKEAKLTVVLGEPALDESEAWYDRYSVIQLKDQESEEVNIPAPKLKGVPEGAPVSYQVAGELPKGLTLNADGSITGKLAAELGTGSVSLKTITLNLRYGGNTTSTTIKREVESQPVLGTGQTLVVSPGGVVAVPFKLQGRENLPADAKLSYAFSPSKSGGTAPAGSNDAGNDKYPTGLAINAANGLLYGTVGAEVKAGVYRVLIAVSGTYDNENTKTILANAPYEIKVTAGKPVLQGENLVYYKETTAADRKLKTAAGNDFASFKVTPAASDKNVYTWKLEDGTEDGSVDGTATKPGEGLPKGLKLSEGGAITGTPDAEVANGRYTFTVRVANAIGEKDTATASILVAGVPDMDPVSSPLDKPVTLAPGQKVALPQLPSMADSGFTYALMAPADVVDDSSVKAKVESIESKYGPINYGLPGGLTVDSTTGEVQGTVLSTVSDGAYVFGVEATTDGVDAAKFTGSTAKGFYTVLIDSKKPVLNQVSTVVYKDVATSIKPNVINAKAGTTYSISGSAVTAAETSKKEFTGYPKGLMIQSSTGTLVGKVDAGVAPGVYYFRVAATNNSESAQTVYRIEVKAKPEFKDQSYKVLAGYVPSAASAELKDRFAVFIEPELKDGGTVKENEYKWNYANGTVQGTAPGENVVPLGVTLYTKTGVLLGNIDESVKPGTYSFSVAASDDTALGGFKATITVSEFVPVSYADKTVAKPGTEVNITPTLPEFDKAKTLKIEADDRAVSATEPGENKLPLGLTLEKTAVASAATDAKGLGVIKGTVDPSVLPGEYVAYLTVSQGSDTTAVGAKRYVPVKIVVEGAAIAAKLDTQWVPQGGTVKIDASSIGAYSYAFKTGQTVGGNPGVGVIPEGLGVSSSTGLVSGTLAPGVKAGEYTFTVLAQGSAGTAPAENKVTVVVTGLGGKNYSGKAGQAPVYNPPVVDGSTGVDTGKAGLRYRFAADQRWSTQFGKGVIPKGVFLNVKTGALAGTVDAQATAGVYTFNVDIYNAEGNLATVAYTVTVTDKNGLTPFTAALAAGGAVNLPTPQSVTGGTYSFAAGSTWSSAPGTNKIPNGLILSRKTGRLQTLKDAALGADVKPGLYTFTVNYIKNGAVSPFEYRVVVLPKGKVTISTLLDGGELNRKIALPEGVNILPAGSAIAPRTEPGAGVPEGLYVSLDGTVSGKLSKNVTPGDYSFRYLVRYNGDLVYTQDDLFGMDIKVSSTTAVEAQIDDLKAAVNLSADLKLAPGEKLSFRFASGTAYSTTAGAGKIPAGLLLSRKNGSIVGSFKTGVNPGLYTFTVDIYGADNSKLGSKVYRLWVGAPVVSQVIDVTEAGADWVSTAPVFAYPQNLPAGAYRFGSGAAYSAEPGLGKVPQGLVISATDGSVRGMTYKAKPGDYTFTVINTSTGSEYVYKLQLRDAAEAGAEAAPQPAAPEPEAPAGS